MSNISLKIDGKGVKATEDMTVLDAARNANIYIPTVCHHEKLEPFGGCRLCVVDVTVGGRTNMVAACVHPVQEAIEVTTRGL